MKEYRYTECGLDNVVIEGMEPVIDDQGEMVYHVPNVNGLHKTIACGIIKHHASISGKELRFLRTEMGLTQAQLAVVLHVDAQTVGRWERSETPIDQTAEVLIRMLVNEKLSLDAFKSVDEAAKLCIPDAKLTVIRVEKTDHGQYNLAA